MYRVAIHEAGHALVAYLQGADLYSATIEPTEEYQGQVRSERPDMIGGEFVQDEAEAKLRTLFGGAEAERVVFGDGQPSPADQESIANLGISHAPVNKDGVADTTIFADQAYEMLEEHRATLESLAEHLLKEGTVSGGVVEAFLAEKVD